MSSILPYDEIEKNMQAHGCQKVWSVPAPAGTRWGSGDTATVVTPDSRIEYWTSKQLKSTPALDLRPNAPTRELVDVPMLLLVNQSTGETIVFEESIGETYCGARVEPQSPDRTQTAP